MGSHIAIYLRLSQEDIDSKNSLLKDESNSIRSQRLMIQRYIQEQPEFAGYPVLEFVDDGYTGTNFDRPQLQKMLSLIRSGEIRCVVVKDLSRFGRNYLEVGDYLEHIFPFLGLRFIAINDHYDSADYKGTTGGVDVAFRNLVYQQYSQDLSQKVKSAVYMKMARGRYVVHCPYGYKKSPGEKHKMVLDPVTAPIVREIFLAAIAGKKSTEIASMLNEKHILTPLEYKNLSRKSIHNEAMWSHQAVLRIIRDYKYTGAMVNFKCENQTIRAKVQKRNSPDEWVVVENSHEPIVSHEEYEAANAHIRKVKPHNTIRHDQTDRVYYCGHCGRRLRKTFGLDEYYSCATSLYREKTECSKIRWSKTDLERIVLAAYKAQLLVMEKEHKKTAVQNGPSPVRVCRETQKKVSREISSIAEQNLRLYERYKAGEYSAETFLEEKTKLFARKKQLDTDLARLQSEEEALLAEQGRAEQQEQYLQKAGALLRLSDEKLLEEMYQTIDKIIVFSNKEIEIFWKLDDCFRTALKG